MNFLPIFPPIYITPKPIANVQEKISDEINFEVSLQKGICEQM